MTRRDAIRLYYAANDTVLHPLRRRRWRYDWTSDRALVLVAVVGAVDLLLFLGLLFTFGGR